MTKFVMDIGNCSYDHSTLAKMLTSKFDAQLIPAEDYFDASKKLSEHSVALILVTRKLDSDYSDGVEVIKKLKENETTREIPVMLLTNFPEHQELAVAAGALYGFGKLQYSEPETLEKLSRYLERK